MATSTISNTITDPIGTAVSGVLVTARLMPTGGFRTAALTEVARVVSTTTNGSGAWSLALERNADITPANTTYEIAEYIPDANGGKRVWNITVGASNQTVLAALTSVLTAAQGSSYLTQAAADARYQALGSLGSGTPGTETPDHAGTAGVSTSASRADHIHPIAAAVAGAIVPDDAAAEGVSTSFSRADHTHAITAGTPVAIGAANAESAGTGFARDAHVHLGAGTLGYAQVTANQGSITTEVDLTSLSATVTVVSGRRIRVTGFVTFSSDAADDTAELRIKESTTQLNRANVLQRPAAIGCAVTAIWIGTPSAGSHTYKLTGLRAAGTGTLTMGASATAPAFILVEDIGT